MKTFISSAILMALLSGCGMFQIRDRKVSEVDKIKKVAIVSFAANIPQSAKVGFNLSKGTFGPAAGGTIVPQSSRNVDLMYASMSESLKKNLKWEVIKLPQMTSNEGYSKAYKRTMEGWQNKMAPPEGSAQFLVKGVMDADSTRILDQAGRNELIEALGVDAIVTAWVNVGINSTSIIGIGNRYPQSRVSFQVHSKGQERPIWFDGGVEGLESTESIGMTAFVDNERVEELALESAKSAFSKIQ